MPRPPQAAGESLACMTENGGDKGRLADRAACKLGREGYSFRLSYHLDLIPTASLLRRT